MAAPQVVAKGADYMAQRIKQVARENGVPVIERKPLARAIYDAVDVGRADPAQAVLRRGGAAGLRDEEKKRRIEGERPSDGGPALTAPASC